MRKIFAIAILGFGFISACVTQDFEIFSLVGFAEGTTGGAGGTSVTVTTGNELQDALDAKVPDTPLTIFVNGLINLDNSSGLEKINIKGVDDVSLIGLGATAEFDGIGIKIYKASNIIVRNVKVHHVLSGDKDCISIEGPADHIWVDHCELFNELDGVGKDDYDGLLDAKGNSEYITYSWNYLHDSWKAMLIGKSDSDTHDRKLTMHHNIFEHINSRLPLFRGSTGHFFNNYFVDIITTAINSRVNSCVFIENNYFEEVQNPWVTAYSAVLGGGDTIGNILADCEFIYDENTLELPYCSPTIPYIYDHVLHSADEVPAVVLAYAGVGKLFNLCRPIL